MRLSEIFAAFQRPQPAAPDGGEAAGTSVRSSAGSAPLNRSLPSGAERGGADRLPDPPPLDDEPADIVAVSREATFTLAASQFDPHRLTPDDMVDLAGLLHDGGAIGPADYALLLNGPSGSYRLSDPAQPRDAIADWQDSLANSMARPDLRSVNAGTRALNILGRIAAIREQL